MPGRRGCEARPEGGALRSPCSSAASACYVRRVTPPQAAVNANSLEGFLFWTLRAPPPVWVYARRCLICSAHGCPKTPALPKPSLLPRLAEPAPVHLFHCCLPDCQLSCRGLQEAIYFRQTVSASPSHVAGSVAAAQEPPRKIPAALPSVDLS